MRKRTSGGSGGVETLPTWHSLWTSAMTSRVPLWWIRPVYRAGTRLATAKRNAAGRRHVCRLATEIPVEAVTHADCHASSKYVVLYVESEPYRKRPYRKAARGR